MTPCNYPPKWGGPNTLSFFFSCLWSGLFCQSSKKAFESKLPESFHLLGAEAYQEVWGNREGISVIWKSFQTGNLVIYPEVMDNPVSPPPTHTHTHTRAQPQGFIIEGRVRLYTGAPNSRLESHTFRSLMLSIPVQREMFLQRVGSICQVRCHFDSDSAFDCLCLICCQWEMGVCAFWCIGALVVCACALVGYVRICTYICIHLCVCPFVSVRVCPFFICVCVCAEVTVGKIQLQLSKESLQEQRPVSLWLLS